MKTFYVSSHWCEGLVIISSRECFVSDFCCNVHLHLLCCRMGVVLEYDRGGIPHCISSAPVFISCNLVAFVSIDTNCDLMSTHWSAITWSVVDARPHGIYETLSARRRTHRVAESCWTFSLISTGKLIIPGVPCRACTSLCTHRVHNETVAEASQSPRQQILESESKLPKKITLKNRTPKVPRWSLVVRGHRVWMSERERQLKNYSCKLCCKSFFATRLQELQKNCAITGRN